MTAAKAFAVGDKVRTRYVGFGTAYGPVVTVSRMTPTTIVLAGADGKEMRQRYRHDGRPVGDHYGTPIVHDSQEIQDEIVAERRISESKRLLTDFRHMPDDVINAAADVIRAYKASEVAK